MRRPVRDIQIFSMSALDVLAMATGVFVLLLLLFMPYYRNTLDAHAEIARLKAQTEQVAADAAARTKTAEADEAAAAALLDAAAGTAARAAELEAAALAARRATPSIPRRVPAKPPPEPPPPQTPVVEELDLVFVIDTTASMTPVVRDMAASMRSIVTILERLVPSLRIAVVSYKDRDTGLPPVEVLPLTPAQGNLPRLVGFLNAISASPIGSNTIEEDVYLGLQAATSLPFRSSARQVVVVIGDAMAHEHEVGPTLALARSFVTRAPGRTISTLFIPTPTARTRGQLDRGFMQQLALAGGGSFNDHAGSLIESILLSVVVD